MTTCLPPTNCHGLTPEVLPTDQPHNQQPTTYNYHHQPPCRSYHGTANRGIYNVNLLPTGDAEAAAEQVAQIMQDSSLKRISLTLPNIMVPPK